MVEAAYKNQNRYQDKVCFITGGTTGIGLAIAHMMALEGGKVIICSSQQKNVDEALNTMKGLHVEGFACNIANKADRAKAGAYIAEKYGKLDVFVANAAIVGGKPTPHIRATEESVDHLYNVNIKGTYFFIVELYPLIKKAGLGANILVTSSVTAEVPPALMGPYAMFKAVLNNMVKSMQKEFMRDKIRINAIAPGVIETDLAKHLLKNKSALPAESYGQPHDISSFVGVMCSD
jgi:NAD(P)-dependent dehydrogenase (short-subunit alcohol dehydrogenase family)